MRRTRWFLAFGLTAALLAAACGSSKSTGGSAGTGGESALPACPLDALANATSPVELVVWHSQSAKPQDALQALADQYNASQSKVRVRLESQGASYEEIQQKFTQAIPSRQLPGLIMVDDTFTQEMADSGVVLPAQSCINADNYDMSGFVKTAVDYYTIKGTLWPASANLGNILFFYNRTHFAKAGLDPNVTPKTLAEVRQFAEKIKAAGQADPSLGLPSTPLVHEMASWKTEFWLTGAGASVVNNDNGRGSGQTTGAALTDNAKATELYTWFKDMKDQGLMQPVAATAGQINQYLAVANQQASMLIDTSSAATSIEAFLSGDKKIAADLGAVDVNSASLDLNAGPFPAMDTASEGKTQMGGAAWYILNTTPPAQQAAAWDFMKFMNTADAQAQMFLAGSFLPYFKAAADVPAMKAALTTTLSGKWLAIANQQVQNIDGNFPGPLIGPYAEFRKQMNASMDNLMFSNGAVQPSLQQAQTGIDKLITDYNQSGF